jgi:hypothetical protein
LQGLLRRRVPRVMSGTTVVRYAVADIGVIVAVTDGTSDA